MKNPSLGALAAMLLIPSASANTLLWSDNFNVADTTNFDGASTAGRLTGTLAATVAAKSARAQQTILGNQLKMTTPASGTGRVRFQNGSAWYDWAAGAAAPTILADGGMRVEFDFTPTDDTSSNWISFSVGFLGTAGGEPITRVNDSQTDYGILFRNNGQTQRFSNGAVLGTGGTITPVLTARHIVLDYAFSSFADGAQVKVRASENGTQVANDTFTWANNSGALYMELGTLQPGSLIDNYTISSIPVIYSLSFTGSPVISGGSQGTEIGFFTSETFAKGSEPATYTFATGAGDTDNAKFQITGDTLQNGSYNFKQDPAGTSYSIRVLGTGASGGTQEKIIQLTTFKDDDLDGIADTWELGFANNLTDLNNTGTGHGSGAGSGDFDGDGLGDLEEYNLSLIKYPTISPILADTDADGLSDGQEVNPSGIRPATNPTLADTDLDGLSDLVESNTGTFVSAADTGTDATKVDTDGDGARDGFELAHGSDALVFNSRPALPAGFALVQVTDDASTGIDPINTYTHKISGGGVATINGVNLDLLSTTATPPDFVWTPSGVRTIVAPINNRTWVPANGGVTGTGLQQMLGGFAYDTIADPKGVQTYILNNLHIGTKYHLKMFIRPWDNVGTSRRPIDLVFTNGSTVAQPFGALILDRPGVVLNNGNEDSAYYLSYTYQAEATQLVITATIPESATAASGSFHLYGLTNAVILPDIYQTWAGQFTGFYDRALYRDSDGDGLANGLEYAFDTNPTSGVRGPITYAAGAVTGHGTPALGGSSPASYFAVFGRRNDYVAAGITYTVEFSADLETWTASADTPAVVASDATIDAVSVPFPATVPAGAGTAAPRFFRVRVSGGN